MPLSMVRVDDWIKYEQRGGILYVSQRKNNPLSIVAQDRIASVTIPNALAESAILPTGSWFWVSEGSLQASQVGQFPALNSFS